MKGVLIGADFLQLENEAKLLEINTDVDIFAMDIPFLNLDNLFNYLTSNSYSKLVLIYKIVHIGIDAVNSFKNRCLQEGIVYDEIIIPNSSITVPSIVEEPNTFYLRCSYDISAIIDDLYCRDKSEIVNLLMGTPNENILPKSYVKYTGDFTILDNLDSVAVNGEHPNLIAKKILPDFNKTRYPAFYKIDGEAELNNIKQNLDDSLILQEFRFNSASLDNDHIFDIARTWTVLLSDVETLIDLGGHFTRNLLPINFGTLSYTDGELDNKWRYMYFSNPMQLAMGVPGDYEVIKYVNGNEVSVAIKDLQVGDMVKSIRLAGLSTDATPGETLAWVGSGSAADLVEYTTASIVRVNGFNNDAVTDYKNYQSWFINLTYESGSISGSSLMATGEAVLVKNSDDTFGFKFASFIKPGDKVVSGAETEMTITNTEFQWYTGSVYTVDMEPDDVFVAGTDSNEISANVLGSIIIHNKWSDIRLKENINKIGTSPSGLNIYEFNYKGHNKKYQGVMAQELIGTNLETAVSSHSGYYMVDYSQLDVNFKMI